MEHVACIMKMNSAYKILVPKSQEKTAFGRPKCRWERNIKIYHKRNRLWECELDSNGWGYSAEVGFCEHSNKPSYSTEIRNFL